jgi:replication factor A1
VALDGTDEAEMICFGDIARRIIGKPVQQVLRTATSSNAYPGDITRLVSLRFTFAVTLTQQSYYRAQKSYQVTSVVTSHGQQVAIPEVARNGGDGGGSPVGSDDTLSGDAANATEQRSPASVPTAGLASPVPAAVSSFYMFTTDHGLAPFIPRSV